MPVSLNDILSNPELEKTVSIDWVKAELKKQPANQYLQGLLSRKINEGGLFSRSSIESLVNNIILDDKRSQGNLSTGDSYFIRDIELDLEAPFAQAEEKVNDKVEKEAAEIEEAENKEIKKNQITSAAIGAGAIITGSIRTGAAEAAEQASPSEEPTSQTDQIEESGLLGFLNRLDGTIKRSQPTPALDPMLKEENYQTNNTEELIEETAEPINEVMESSDNEEIQNEAIQEVVTGSKEPQEKKVKKKKKVKVKANHGLRWSSMTPSDYKIKTLDPFTEWINTIDGVELVEAKKPEKSKKAKKKKKKGQHLDSLKQKPEIASEQLADLLVNQGHIQQAIGMYERLSLNYPEKSSFFAAKIDTIKDKL